MRDIVTNEEMVKKFQCPGCVLGEGGPVCRDFRWRETSCSAHVVGTTASPGGKFALGLPKGFCKAPLAGKMTIRLWTMGTSPSWNNLNVPVWAMERDGFLFVRTYMPRIDLGVVDVIEGGTMALVPQAIDVAKFYGDID